MVRRPARSLPDVRDRRVYEFDEIEPSDRGDARMRARHYPKWQAWLQKAQPRLLVIWGKHDLSFDLGEPERYRKDVPNAKVLVLDAGHFALDTKADEIAQLVREFMKTRE